MNITVAKIKRILKENYEWTDYDLSHFLTNEAIRDTLKVIDNQLRIHKGFKIKNRIFTKK